MFATVDELSSFLQTDFEADQQITAELLLQLATGRIQGWTNQTLAPVSDDTYETSGWFGRLILPHPPAVPVTVVSVEVDDEPVDYSIDRYHVLRRDRGFDGDTVVTYQHGFETVPADVKEACLKLAVRQMTNPTYSQSVKIEGFSETFQTATATSEQAILAELSRYRQVGVA
jgi:hypothetical protein